MPIEIKKPISSIADLTCENCIHYQKSGEDWCCINPDSYDWDRLNGDCCSNGIWFRMRQYPDCDTSEIDIYGYTHMMLLFAEEKMDATRS